MSQEVKRYYVPEDYMFEETTDALNTGQAASIVVSLSDHIAAMAELEAELAKKSATCINRLAKVTELQAKLSKAIECLEIIKDVADEKSSIGLITARVLSEFTQSEEK